MDRDGMLARPNGRGTLVLATALAVVLTGCSGFGLIDSGSEDVSRPANLDHDEVVDRHREALREAGTFNATQTLTLASNRSSSQVSLTYEYAVDLERDRAIRLSPRNGETVRYTAGNTTYKRADLGGSEPNYDVTNHTEESGGFFSPSRVNVTEAIGAVYVPVDAVEFRYVGEETFRGTTVERYVANGTDALEGPLPTLLGSVNVSDATEGSGLGNGSADAGVQGFSATLLVDRNGVVRLVDWKVTIVDEELNGRSTIGIRHVITDVETATVEPPDWIDEARQQAEPITEWDNCGAPVAEGSFDQRPAGNGTYNVTYEVTTLENGSWVTLEHPDAELGTSFERSAIWEGTVATTRGLEPGTTVEAVAENLCDDTPTVGTYTVTDGGNESETDGRIAVRDRSVRDR